MFEHERIYVGNLSSDVTENDIKKRFKKFHVSKVEIKRKNFDDNENVFAYINIPKNLTHKAVEDMNNFEWNGKHLKVQRAKEDFLSKLKKERVKSETNFSSLNPSNTVSELCNNTELNNTALNNTAMTEKITNYNRHYRYNGETGYLKNNHKQNTENRLNVVKKRGVEINYELQKKQKSNIQRDQAVKEKKQLIERKRKHISNALNSPVNNTRLNKKIRFDENEDTMKNSDLTENRLKLKLFDSSDDESDNNLNDQFRLETHFSETNTSQIIKVTASAAGDDRFRLNERFFDDDIQKDPNKGNEDEKKRQLDILAEITGPLKQQLRNKNEYQTTPHSFVRYDPTLEEHSKYAKRSSVKTKKSTKRVKNKEVRDEKPITSNVAVDKLLDRNSNEGETPVEKVEETINPVVITNSSKLEEVLKVDGSKPVSEISLRNMFSRAQTKLSGTSKQNNESKKEVSTYERINPTKLPPVFSDNDYTSDEHDDSEKPIAIEAIDAESQKYIWTEKFFFELDDPRFNEATKLFAKERNKNEEETVRLALKSLLKATKSKDDEVNRPVRSKSAGFRKRRFDANRKRKRFPSKKS